MTELAPVEPWDDGPPRINGPRVVGSRPGHALLFAVPVTGSRPLTFEADGLPDGVTIDAVSGVIAGVATAVGESVAEVVVRNDEGTDRRELRIAVGESIALTPPLGWNSWNCWGSTVDEAKVRAAAAAMVSSGLAAHGFSYINIDDGWQGERGGEIGAIQPNEKFSDMARLCADIHALGLRAGVYSTPWTTSYAGFLGGSSGGEARVQTARAETEQWHRERGWFFGEVAHHDADARQWAAWGVDYLKYDWGPWQPPDVEAMAAALRSCGRDIVYSLSNTAPFEGASEWARLAQVYRTTGDITDRWENVSAIGFGQDRWAPFNGPGHWADPDMLVVGRLGWGQGDDGGLRDNRLTADEQVTHISLWALLSAPLLLGCDLSSLDDLTLRLLTNDEVLAVNQDPLGRQAQCVRDLRRADSHGATVRHEVVYSKPFEDGSLAVGFFNRGDEAATVEVSWGELDVSGTVYVRDLWARDDLGGHASKLAAPVAPHGARLFRLS